MERISIIDDFNQVSLHNPSEKILKLYAHIPEINELDPRGYKMCRPLFSHSDVPYFLECKNVKAKDFDWSRNFIYSVCLHHHNALAAKHLNLIPAKILEQVRLKKCRLILDNTLEGDRVYDFYTQLHISCAKLKLPIDQIYYVTNSLVAEKEFNRWREDNETLVKDVHGKVLNVISVLYNVHDVKRIIREGNLPEQVDIEEEIYYKEKNLSNIKHFLKVNRTGRPERNLYMLFVNKEKLYDKHLLSFPEYPDYEINPQFFPEYNNKANIRSLASKLPFDIDITDKLNHGEPGYGEGKFNADLPFQPIHYRNSFMSVVMCAFPFVHYACHLHSSTFNPMYCMHPILQFGPHKHLQELKDRNFKTFEYWWDESYDEDPEGWNRVGAVIDIVKILAKKSPEEMLKMYKEMAPTLQHNHNTINSYSILRHLNERIFNGTLI